MAIVQLHAKRRVRERFGHDSVELESFLFGHYIIRYSGRADCARTYLPAQAKQPHVIAQKNAVKILAVS
jgi:collagenase-like PrtC family protease